MNLISTIILLTLSLATVLLIYFSLAIGLKLGKILQQKRIEVGKMSQEDADKINSNMDLKKVRWLFVVSYIVISTVMIVLFSFR